MKLTIHNKLVILKKNIVPLFITKFIWIIIVHFFFIYYALATFIIYYLFIQSKLAIGKEH